MPIRLVIADDHPIILEGLRSVFASEAGEFEVLAECPDGTAAGESIRKGQPDVAIINLRMPPAGAFPVLRQAREEAPSVRMVLFTAALSEAQLLEAIRVGIAGVVLKHQEPGAIVECVRQVMAGERWIEMRAVTALLDRVASGATVSSPWLGLTRREHQIMRLAASGLRNREISRRLRIREGTVKVHLHKVYRKLGVKGRIELAIHARTHGLI